MSVLLAVQATAFPGVWVLLRTFLVDLLLFFWTLRMFLIPLAGVFLLVTVGRLVSGMIRSARLRQSGIHEIDHMSGLDFEKRLALLFRDLGYEAEVTKATGDRGADVVIEKEGVKIVVQAKRYKGHHVNPVAISRIHSAKTIYHADRAMVVTNSWYTPQARDEAKALGVELWDRSKLIKMLLEAEGRRGGHTPTRANSGGPSERR